VKNTPVWIVWEGLFHPFHLFQLNEINDLCVEQAERVEQASGRTTSAAAIST
jgi:hypothetical protein